MFEVAPKPLLRSEKRVEVKTKVYNISPFNYNQAIANSRIRLDEVIRQVNEKGNFQDHLVILPNNFSSS